MKAVEHVEIIVEELSMEVALRDLLPKLLGDVSFAIYPHQCKEDLLARLPERLAGYARWLPQTYRIVVIVDRDDDDCRKLLRTLEKMAKSAGISTRAASGRRPWQLVHRLSIEELEAWYFGDWAAVQAAYPRVPANVPHQRGYRDPDAIAGGTWEALERVLQRAGYFVGGLRKLEAAREISPHMVPSRNTSRSFGKLREVLRELSAGGA